MRATGLVCAILKTIRLFSSELNKPFSPVARASPSLHFIVSTSPHSLDSSPLTLVNRVRPPWCSINVFCSLRCNVVNRPQIFAFVSLSPTPPLPHTHPNPTPKPLPLIRSSQPHLLSKFSPNPLFLRQHLYGPDRWAGYIYSVSV